MTTKVMNVAKLTAHVVLLGISGLLSINLFIQLAIDPLSQVLLASMAGALEIMKIWLFVHAKYLFRKKEEKIKGKVNTRTAALFTFVLYLSLALISTVASVGYSLTTVEKQSFTVQQNTEFETTKVDMIKEEIENINVEIDDMLRRLEQLPQDWLRETRRLSDKIDRLRERKRDLQKELIAEQEKLQEKRQGQQRQKATDIFSSLGEYINRDGKTTMKLILLLLAVMLEICSAVSAPNEENIQRRKVKDRVEAPGKRKRSSLPWEEFVESLFRTGGSERLKPIPKVAKEISIDIETAKKMRNILLTVKKEGKPLLTRNRSGAMYATFEKDTIMRIARNYL